MTLITCQLCSLVFSTVDQQHNHFKSALHRHNLRRKICGLQSINDAEYQQFLIKSENAEKINDQYADFVCNSCSKHFQTKNQMSNHLQSKKHKCVIERSSEINASESENDLSNVKQEDSMPIDNNRGNEITIKKESFLYCLFCNDEFNTLNDNLTHMLFQHGFQIPFDQYVTSMEALISYLREKMEILHECLQCHSKRFSSLESVRKHMLDKQHLVIDPFSDYSNMDLIDYFNVPLEDDDVEDNEDNEIDDNEYEMSLPSGSVIGHRALKLYYRQRFNPSRELCKMEPRSLLKCDPVLQQQTYKVNRKGTEAEKNYFVSLGVKANRLQKHFRQQVDF